MTGCPGIAYIDSEPHECGLLWPHDGPHVPFAPGVYLAANPPLLRALDPRGLLEPCPSCGARIQWLEELAAWWVREAEMQVAYAAPRPGAVPEVLWRFEPCGCERREILPTPPAAPA